MSGRQKGHEQSIGFSLEGYTANVPPLTEDNGLYRGGFVVSEASVGVELFKPGETDTVGTSLVPRVVILTISDNSGTVVVAEREVRISRWACDRCHLDQQTAMEVYSWCAPAGGPLGPHNWPHVLGRNGGRPGFTYANLTNDALTHSPTVGGCYR